MLFPFITGKNFAFRIIVEIITALWLYLALQDERYRPKKSWLTYGVWAFVGIIAVADLLGENPLKSIWSNFERMEGLVSLIHFALYFTVLSAVFNTQKIWNYFLGTWVGSSVLMCIYALFQLGGTITINQGGVRVDGTFGNAIYLAVFLMFTIFFSTFLILQSNQKKNQLWWYVPAVLLQSIILYHTATRGSVLGLIVGVLATVLLIIFFDHGRKDSVLRKASIGVIVGFIVLMVGFFAVRDTEFVKTSPVLSRFSSLSISEVKTQGRFFIWPMAVSGALERPILGWGQENFNYIFNKDYDPRMYNQESWFDRAHSAPLDWLVAGGVLGFVSYLSLFGFALWILWKKKHEFTFLQKSIVTGLLCAYIFQAIFVFDNLISYILLFTLLAYIEHGLHQDTVRIPPALSSKSNLPIISAVLTVLCIGSIYFLNIRPIQTSRTLIKALQTASQKDYKNSLDAFEQSLSYGFLGQAEVREQLAASAQVFLSNGVPQDIQERYVLLTKQEFEKQIMQAPNDMRYLNFYGVFLRSIGDTKGGLAYLERAQKLSPKKQAVLFDIGATYIVSKEFDKAIAVYKEAYELDTSYENAKVSYAIAAIYADNEILANELLSKISRNTLLNDDRIVSVLAEKGRYAEIVPIFKERIAEGKDSFENYVSLAVSYYKSGDSAGAIKTLRTLEQVKPERKTEVDQFINQIMTGAVPK